MRRVDSLEQIVRSALKHLREQAVSVIAEEMLSASRIHSPPLCSNEKCFVKRMSATSNPCAGRRQRTVSNAALAGRVVSTLAAHLLTATSHCE